MFAFANYIRVQLHVFERNANVRLFGKMSLKSVSGDDPPSIARTGLLCSERGFAVKIASGSLSRRGTSIHVNTSTRRCLTWQCQQRPGSFYRPICHLSLDCSRISRRAETSRGSERNTLYGRSRDRAVLYYKHAFTRSRSCR